MPNVISPDEALSEKALIQRHSDLIPKPLQQRLLSDTPIEIRFADPADPLAEKTRAPNHKIWIRANGKLPDNPGLHKYLLAYASDFQFLSTCLYPPRGSHFSETHSNSQPGPRHVVPPPHSEWTSGYFTVLKVLLPVAPGHW